MNKGNGKANLGTAAGNGSGRDTRVVYGARCTYWGSIYTIGTLPIDGDPANVLPCCPHCKGMLFETDNEEAFLAGARAHEAKDHSGYVDFVIWMKERPCRHDIQEMVDLYKQETGKSANL